MGGHIFTEIALKLGQPPDSASEGCIGPPQGRLHGGALGGNAPQNDFLPPKKGLKEKK